MDKQDRPRTRRMQAYNRMRAPIKARPFTLQWHVIQAIRRRSEIANGESLYQDALRELLNGSVAEVLDDFDAWAKGIVSGELQGKEKEEGIRIIDKANELVNPDEEYPNLAKFNREFLNSSGQLALIYSLVVDAADLDLVALDKYRGGSSLQAAYEHPKRTQAVKREGKRIQALLKRLFLFDEDAMSDAADWYVIYRHVYQGNFHEYTIKAEQDDSSFSEGHDRRWFRDFDDALRHSAPRRGRPPKKTYPTKPHQDKGVQRKVHRSRGYKHS